MKFLAGLILILLLARCSKVAGGNATPPELEPPQDPHHHDIEVKTDLRIKETYLVVPADGVAACSAGHFMVSVHYRPVGKIECAVIDPVNTVCIDGVCIPPK